MHVRKKVLCICEGGANRSVSLATILKHHLTHGHDALAAGWRYNDPGTLEMLCAWADLIVVMQPDMVLRISPAHRGKTKVCDVGPDNYGHPYHLDLVQKVVTWARAEGLIN